MRGSAVTVGVTGRTRGDACMSTIDETPDTAVRGAQTVAPVQASALLFAASILGEASYTPTRSSRAR